MGDLWTDLRMDRPMYRPMYRLCIDLCIDIFSYLITYKDASITIISMRQSFLFGFIQIMVQEADVSNVSSERLG
jgi:hypothetical protein